MNDEPLTRLLERADFSAASKVRLPLRARLLSRSAARRPRPVLALATLALAALAVSLWRAPSAPPFLHTRGEHGLPVMPGRLPASGAAETPLIRAVPGRIVDGARSRAIVWELDGTRISLETRRTSIEEIFVRPAL